MSTPRKKRGLRWILLKLREWRVYRAALKRIHAKGLAEIRTRYTEGWDEPLVKVKYFDLNHYLWRDVVRAFDLGLDGPERKRVLDMGSGFGYFVFLCQELGHLARGLDLPRPDKASDRLPTTWDLYADTADLLGIQREFWEIQPFRALPRLTDAPFDVITANEVTFNGLVSRNLWGVDEWAFFLDDLGGLLRDEGTVALTFNLSHEGHFFCDRVHGFFTSRGATIAGPTVRFLREDLIG